MLDVPPATLTTVVAADHEPLVVSVSAVTATFISIPAQPSTRSPEATVPLAGDAAAAEAPDVLTAAERVTFITPVNDSAYAAFCKIAAENVTVIVLPEALGNSGERRCDAAHHPGRSGGVDLMLTLHRVRVAAVSHRRDGRGRGAEVVPGDPHDDEVTNGDRRGRRRS